MGAPPLDSPCDRPVTYPGDTKILVKSSKGWSRPSFKSNALNIPHKVILSSVGPSIEMGNTYMLTNVEINIQPLVLIFLSMFISFLYMFRVTMGPSSGETTVFMWHLVLVILCGWRTGMQGGMGGWAQSCPKHVQKRNEHTKKIVDQVGFIYKIYTAFLCGVSIVNGTDIIHFTTRNRQVTTQCCTLPFYVFEYLDPRGMR